MSPYCGEHRVQLLAYGTLLGAKAGLSHAEAGTIRAQDDSIMTEMAKPIDMREVVHTQLSKEKAAEVFKSWRKDY